MSTIYQSFRNLSSLDNSSSILQVDEIYPDLPHKIGCSKEGFPMIFVECSDNINTTNIQLKLFAVLFNQHCELKEGNGNPISKKFSIIQLNSTRQDFQRYFIEVMAIVLRKLDNFPKTTDLKNEVQKVITMFKPTSSFSKEIVIGLWAELFVIAKSKDPEYLIDSWHVTPEDKFDFNDGSDKIEVKATRNMERIHTFSLEQLNPNHGSRLAIASIITLESGKGTNIFNIVDYISRNISDTNTILKLQEIVYETIGPHIEEAQNITIDEEMAINTYAIYNYQDIPSIKAHDVPSGVTKVHFSSCLKDCPKLEYKDRKCVLHQALS